MKRLLALAALALASCASKPETFRVEPMAREWTVLPVRFENDLPIVEVQVGARKIPVLLDLGAGATVWLEPEAAEEAGARWTGEETTFHDAYGKAWVGRGYVLPECRLGDVVLRDVEGREHPPARGGTSARGLLGWRVLLAFRVLFDYAGKGLVLSSGALPPDVRTESWTPVPYRVSADGIGTDVVWSRKPLVFVWDTGANRCVMRESWAREDLLVWEGEQMFCPTDSLRIGGRDFGHQKFTVLDLAEPSAAALVGGDFFQKHRVLIDPAQGKLFIE